jgi:hypothetical protein
LKNLTTFLEPFILLASDVKMILNEELEMMWTAALQELIRL